jgi:hypothetical protein
MPVAWATNEYSPMVQPRGELGERSRCSDLPKEEYDTEMHNTWSSRQPFSLLLQKINYVSGFLAGVSALLALVGCTVTKPVLVQVEEFDAGNTYSRSFAGTGEATCEAARRALLGQGYLVSEAKKTMVKANKNFQLDSEVHIQVEFNVVCAANHEGSGSTTAFANAVRDTYSLKKSTNSASVGISVIGSLSLPIGSSDDSLVKVASETITSKLFYDQFFEHVDSNLDDPKFVPESDQNPESTAGAPLP